jgi:hypothetical protein
MSNSTKTVGGITKRANGYPYYVTKFWDDKGSSNKCRRYYLVGRAPAEF